MLANSMQESFQREPYFLNCPRIMEEPVWVENIHSEEKHTLWVVIIQAL
jgi:hypothetical protein